MNVSFHSLGYIFRSRIAESYGNPVFQLTFMYYTLNKCISIYVAFFTMENILRAKHILKTLLPPITKSDVAFIEKTESVGGYGKRKHLHVLLIFVIDG